ncbi:hypothetical protein ACFQY0_04815 [Haloferula chungangensis]|uniref:Uncharacterized protein n=1 Tax=Haloferula chungangensis TaxID=1048331 RepID=A0ABW2L4L2_9BACT
MMTADPYAPPSSGEPAATSHEPSALREVVVAWEKMRWIYNLILLLPGLIIVSLMVLRHEMPVRVGVVGAMMVGIGANMAYFLGPLTELYFRAIFRNGEPIGQGRKLIFAAGLVVSAGVFLLALLGALV